MATKRIGTGTHSAPAGTPAPLPALPGITGRCPMCGYSETYPAPWPEPWQPIGPAVPVLCPWDGTIIEEVGG